MSPCSSLKFTLQLDFVTKSLLSSYPKKKFKTKTLSHACMCELVCTAILFLFLAVLFRTRFTQSLRHCNHIFPIEHSSLVYNTSYMFHHVACIDCRKIHSTYVRAEIVCPNLDKWSLIRFLCILKYFSARDCRLKSFESKLTYRIQLWHRIEKSLKISWDATKKYHLLSR